MGLSPEWEPVYASFARHTEDGKFGPFLCLIRFDECERPTAEALNAFVEDRAARAQVPITFRVRKDGQQPHGECSPVGSAHGDYPAEWIFVSDTGSFTRQLTLGQLAGRAGALLPANGTDERHLITKPDVPCELRLPLQVQFRWFRAVLAALHRRGVLQSQMLPEARAEAFWFDADAFQASLTAIGFEIGQDRSRVVKAEGGGKRSRPASIQGSGVGRPKLDYSEPERMASSLRESHPGMRRKDILALVQKDHASFSLEDLDRVFDREDQKMSRARRRGMK